MGEINSDLIKNNKSYRVAFGHNMLMYFFTQEDEYYTENGFYNDDDSLMIRYLDKLVTAFSFSKKLVAAVEEINTDLPILFS